MYDARLETCIGAAQSVRRVLRVDSVMLRPFSRYARSYCLQSPAGSLSTHNYYPGQLLHWRRGYWPADATARAVYRKRLT